eukprot:COSAG05_NODE_6196_length_1002_cov_1.219269_1_plen_230_part_00
MWPVLASIAWGRIYSCTGTVLPLVECAHLHESDLSTFDPSLQYWYHRTSTIGSYQLSCTSSAQRTAQGVDQKFSRRVDLAFPTVYVEFRSGFPLWTCGLWTQHHCVLTTKITVPYMNGESHLDIIWRRGEICGRYPCRSIIHSICPYEKNANTYSFGIIAASSLWGMSMRNSAVVPKGRESLKSDLSMPCSRSLIQHNDVAQAAAIWAAAYMRASSSLHAPRKSVTYNL